LEVEAQTPNKIPKIGVLVSSSRASENVANREAFHESLRKLGYIEGRNVEIEHRYADGDRNRRGVLASELVEMKVDVIVAGGIQSTTAAKRATSTIPIVAAAAADLVAARLVTSLARPAGNVTGSTRMTKDLSGKRMDLLKEMMPKLSRIAVVLSSGTSGLDRGELKETETAASRLGVTVQTIDVADPKEFQSGFAAIVRERAEAVIILHGSFTLFHRKELVALANKNRLPSMCEQREWINVGCLLSYGPDVAHLWSRAAVFVDKILNGAKPADLPVEQPTKFELIFNLKTAKQIGLTIPQWMLVKADKVIR
jgi:putative ABC transport system substrate-binding protein